MIDANPVEGVNKVIGVTKLRKNYGQYKDKRDLLTSHDLFLADERIVPLLPALLGKKFFMKKKQPVPVCLTRKKLKEELSAARDSTYLFLSAGPCCAFKVATSAFTKLQVLENVMSSIDAAVDKIPRKWKNVQAIHIKTHDSVALPIFNSLPGTARPAATVARPPAKKGKRKLSTKKKASIKSKKSKQ